MFTGGLGRSRRFARFNRIPVLIGHRPAGSVLDGAAERGVQAAMRRPRRRLWRSTASASPAARDSVPHRMFTAAVELVRVLGGKLRAALGKKADSRFHAAHSNGVALHMSRGILFASVQIPPNSLTQKPENTRTFACLLPDLVRAKPRGKIFRRRTARSKLQEPKYKESRRQRARSKGAARWRAKNARLSSNSKTAKKLPLKCAEQFRCQQLRRGNTKPGAASGGKNEKTKNLSPYGAVTSSSS